MRRSRVLQAVVLLAGLDSGCTFYTSCPTGNNNPTPGGGGTGNGGSGSNMGGNIVSGGKPPMAEWANETANLTGMDSECGNISVFSVKPDEDLLLLTVALHGVFAKASVDEDWHPLGQGKGSAAEFINRGSAFIYDPEHPQVFWESGTHRGNGVYRTDDDGDTFIDLGVPHNDYVSIDFTDPERKTLLASGHEQPHTLYRTTEGGTTWEQIGDKIPDAAQVCSYPVIIDASTYLLGCATYGGGDKSIYRSTDAGETWDLVSNHAGGAAPLFASDGSIYFAGEPRDGLVRSTDQGKTWSDALGAGELWQARPIELPDGRIAALGQKRILVSADQGDTWKVVTAQVPYDANGIGYSPIAKKLYLFHFTCEAPVPEDGVQSYPFDYETD